MMIPLEDRGDGSSNPLGSAASDDFMVSSIDGLSPPARARIREPSASMVRVWESVDAIRGVGRASGTDFKWWWETRTKPASHLPEELECADAVCEHLSDSDGIFDRAAIQEVLETMMIVVKGPEISCASLPLCISTGHDS